MKYLIVSLGLVVAVQACASRGTAVSDPTSNRSTAARPRTNVISTQEIAERPELISVRDVVRQLRPGWPMAVTVFLNNDPMGDISNLSSLPTSNAKEIRYYTVSEAQMKWGYRYREVIQVVTK